MCAKLLYSFGAKHTVMMTDEAQQAIDDLSMDEITMMVKNEKVCSSLQWLEQEE